MRRAAKRDTAERPIIDGLVSIGAQVEQLDYPVDLAVRFQGRIYLLEVKTPKANKGRVMQARQRAQATFCALWEIPYVETAEQALRAIGAIP